MLKRKQNIYLLLTLSIPRVREQNIIYTSIDPSSQTVFQMVYIS
jgi:hypothetical protein